MRAVRNSPIFRIAVLAFTVLFAQTVRANTRPVVAACAPCPGKVAAAQPEPQKNLPAAARRTARPRPDRATLSSGAFHLARAHQAARLPLAASGHNAVAARSTLSIEPQRRPFVLRI